MTLAVEIEAADPDPEPVSLRGASPPGVGAGGSSYAIVPESGAEAKKCRLVEQDRLTFFFAGNVPVQYILSLPRMREGAPGRCGPLL